MPTTVVPHNLYQATELSRPLHSDSPPLSLPSEPRTRMKLAYLLFLPLAFAGMSHVAFVSFANVGSDPEPLTPVPSHYDKCHKYCVVPDRGKLVTKQGVRNAVCSEEGRKRLCKWSCWVGCGCTVAPRELVGDCGLESLMGVALKLLSEAE